MRKCAFECLKKNKSCKEQACRMWIDYEKDLNCTLIAVEKDTGMSLNEVAKRLHISLVRVKQIQDKAIQKLQKRNKKQFLF